MSETIFDLEIINPSKDLVTFTCYQGPFFQNQDAVVTYTLGKDFKYSPWDWVGLFYRDWKSVYEYHAYQWAPTQPSHQSLKRRRSVLFQAEQFSHLKNWDTIYQFLYVTSGAHVAGVSVPFRFRNLNNPADLFWDTRDESIPVDPAELEKQKKQLYPGFEGDLHLDLLEYTILHQKREKRKFKSKPILGYELVHRTEPFSFTDGPMISSHLQFDKYDNDLFKTLPMHRYDVDINLELLEKSCVGSNALKKKGRSLEKKKWMRTKKEMNRTHTPKKNMSSPIKKCVRKEKVTYVLRDHDTLNTSFPLQTSVLDILQIIENNNIVKKYDENKAESDKMSVVPYVLPKAILDLLGLQKEAQGKNNTSVPKIDFPVRLPVMPGPRSILLAMEESGRRCHACALGRKIMIDTIQRCEKAEEEARNSQNRNRALAKEVEKQRNLKNIEKVLISKQQELRLRDSVERIAELEKAVKSMENQLNEERDRRQITSAQNNALTQTCIEEDQCLQDAFAILSNRGFKRLIDEEGNLSCFADVCEKRDAFEDWKQRFPKKIERMRLVISNQSVTIQNLAQSVMKQRDAIARQLKNIKSLRNQLSNLESTYRSQERKITDMDKAFRTVLQLRRSSFRENNEWRLFARINLHSQTAEKLAKTSPVATQKQTIQNQKTGNCTAHDGKLALIQRKKSEKRHNACPTCGMTFSPEVDIHLIEEHIVFHERYGNKKKFM